MRTGGRDTGDSGSMSTENQNPASSSLPTCGVALLGCGAVGSAVAEYLLHRGDLLTARSGVHFQLRRVVVRDASRRRSVPVPPHLVSTDPLAAAADPGVHVVIELLGGEEPARSAIMAALSAGRDVVTANKALLALHGSALLAAARRAGRCIAFEGAVGGGIPLVDAIRRGLAANEIHTVVGILNGTCNYILTRMLDARVSYAEALREAQQLGYAEADPSLDVNGVDSAHKLAILASLALRRPCALDRIAVRGIADLDLTDLLAGRELGYVCKLLAVAHRQTDGLDLSVQPTFIRTTHPLAGVAGPFNAVSVYGDAVGHCLFYGRGAGGRPTASAVLADLIDVAIGNARRSFDTLAFNGDAAPPVYRDPGENISPYYLRVRLADQPGGMGKLATALGHANVSIASLMQREPQADLRDGAVPVVATTHPAREADIRAAIESVRRLDVVRGPVVCIPVLAEHSEPGA